jgi:nicotinic acid mononucleotide adenylyltransferase
LHASTARRHDLAPARHRVRWLALAVVQTSRRSLEEIAPEVSRGAAWR